jgi:hypothetical protein
MWILLSYTLGLGILFSVYVPEPCREPNGEVLYSKVGS